MVQGTAKNVRNQAESAEDMKGRANMMWKCGSLSFIFIHPPEDLKQILKLKSSVVLTLKYFALLLFHCCSSHPNICIQTNADFYATTPVLLLRANLGRYA